MFLGLGVPEHVRERLKEEARRSFGNYFKDFVPEENWHLTLFFFGDIKNPEQYLPRLKQPLPQAFVPTISITHIGRGAKRDQLWAYVNPTAGFLSLRDSLDERLRKIHFPRPVQERKYIPHLRLATFYPTVSGLGVTDVGIQLAYATQEAYLYRSISTNSQVRYERATTIPFRS